MRCANCGHPLEPGQRFCTQCGYENDEVDPDTQVADATAFGGISAADGMTQRGIEAMAEDASVAAEDAFERDYFEKAGVDPYAVPADMDAIYGDALDRGDPSYAEHSYETAQGRRRRRRISMVGALIVILLVGVIALIVYHNLKHRDESAKFPEKTDEAMLLIPQTTRPVSFTLRPFGVTTLSRTTTERRLTSPSLSTTQARPATTLATSAFIIHEETLPSTTASTPKSETNTAPPSPPPTTSPTDPSTVPPTAPPVTEAPSTKGPEPKPPATGGGPGPGPEPTVASSAPVSVAPRPPLTPKPSATIPVTPKPQVPLALDILAVDAGRYPMIRVFFSLLDEENKPISSYEASKIRVEESFGADDTPWVDQSADLVFKESSNLMIVADVSREFLQGAPVLDPLSPQLVSLREALRDFIGGMTLSPEPPPETTPPVTEAEGAEAVRSRTAPPVTTSPAGGDKPEPTPVWDTVGLIQYGAETEELQSFTPYARLANEAIDSLHDGGEGSLFYDTLCLSLLNAREATQSALVVITSGRDTGSYYGLDEVRDLATATRVPLHIIHCSTDKDEANKPRRKETRISGETLRELALATQGTYRRVDSLDTLRAALQATYSHDREELFLQYRSTATGGNATEPGAEHRLRLSYRPDPNKPAILSETTTYHVPEPSPPPTTDVKGPLAISPVPFERRTIF